MGEDTRAGLGLLSTNSQTMQQLRVSSLLAARRESLENVKLGPPVSPGSISMLTVLEEDGICLDLDYTVLIMVP